LGQQIVETVGAGELEINLESGLGLGMAGAGDIIIVCKEVLSVLLINVS